MSLPDAIREGSKRRPQTRGSLFGSEGSCALGAALEGAGLNDHDMGKLVSLYPELILAKDIACPQCEVPLGGLDMVIIHLNDDEGWSREKIADWIEYEFYDKYAADLESGLRINSVPEALRMLTDEEKSALHIISSMIYPFNCIRDEREDYFIDEENGVLATKS
jgi:hypothetical protein